MTSAERFRAAAEQLAPMVALWRRILATHTRSPQGFCAANVCREGGSGRVHVSYPCPVRVAAKLAEALHDRSKPPRG